MDINAECPMLSWPHMSDGRKLDARMTLMKTSAKDVHSNFPPSAMQKEGKEHYHQE